MPFQKGQPAKLEIYDVADTATAEDPTSYQVHYNLWVGADTTDLTPFLAYNPGTDVSCADLADTLTFTDSELYDLVTGA
jgi:hypothetical protein